MRLAEKTTHDYYSLSGRTSVRQTVLPNGHQNYQLVQKVGQNQAGQMRKTVPETMQIKRKFICIEMLAKSLLNN